MCIMRSALNAKLDYDWMNSQKRFSSWEFIKMRFEKHRRAYLIFLYQFWEPFVKNNYYFFYFAYID